MIYHTKLPIWRTMVCACSHVWEAEFIVEYGTLTNVDSAGEECPECGSNEIEEAQ